MSVNKTIIQGRLTRDPELRSTQTGKPVCGFTVAWSEKVGENEQQLFLSCVAWGKTAEFMPRYFSKGQELLVEGKLTTRKWTDRDGNNRETVELVADRVHFCGPKQDHGGQQAQGYPGGYQQGYQGNFDPMAAMGSNYGGAPKGGYGAPQGFAPYAPGPEDDNDLPV